MKTSIVIPTYKRPGLAENLKKEILRFNPEVQIIIIDQTNQSPNTSAAKNQGIAQATGEVIIFLDDDVEITKNTVQAHILEYTNPDVMGVAGRVINDGEIIPEVSSVKVGNINSLFTVFEKNFWSTKKQTVEFPYGCNMSFRKSALDITGGFDEKLPPPLSSFEEIDLAIRIRKLGLISFVPDALVYHHRATSGGTRMDTVIRTKLYYQSYGMIIRKHIPFPLSLVSLGIVKFRVIRECPHALINLIKGYIYV